MSRIARLLRLQIVFVALLASGCVTSPVYRVAPTPQQAECVRPARAPDGDVLIGLSVSGGGSRAALFAAGGLEALSRLQVGPDHRSLLDQVSYISSVSGGSMASAYYVLKKPSHATRVLTANGEISKEYQRFFAGFKDAMAQDYEGPLLRRQIFRLRWFNPAWTARSLAEIMNEKYLGDANFAALARREAQGDSPYLLVNTTLYNDARRFVVTTLDPEALRYDFVRELERSPGQGELDEEVQRLLQTRWETLQSRTPGDLHLDVCSIKVAAAVAASMSFPPVIGPITFRVGDQDPYWHAGDGGLSDNSGAESVLMVALKRLQEGKTRRVLIISLDSSFPFDVGGKSLSFRSEGFSLFTYDYSRIPSIMEERSNAYRTFFFRVAQREGLLPDERTLTVVVLRHTDAVWKEDLSDLPESCREEKVNWKSPKDVGEHLAGIVTRLWLKSTCDRDLVVTAAAKVVAQNESKIGEFLEPR
ncbi:MAG: patatin-like phospholipase family protein [Nitrospirota bacterium]